MNISRDFVAEQTQKETLQAALETWRSAGGSGQFLCDQTTVALIFGGIQLLYDKRNGLRLRVSNEDLPKDKWEALKELLSQDPETHSSVLSEMAKLEEEEEAVKQREIDMTSYSQIQGVRFGPNYPIIQATFRPRSTTVRHEAAKVGNRGASIEEQMKAWKEFNEIQTTSATNTEAQQQTETVTQVF